MKRIITAAALGAFLFVAPSCSEAEAAPKSEAETVAGTYNIDATAMAKAMGTAEDQMADVVKAIPKMVNVMNADLTYSSTMEMMGEKMSVKGTWTVKDGAITFNQTHANDAEAKDTSTGTYKDGVVTIEARGQKMVFNKVAEKPAEKK